MLKVIFFDAAGTLIHLPRSVGSHYSEVALRFGARIDAAALDNAFRACWRQMPARAALDGPRPDDDKGWWRELVGKTLARALDADRLALFDEAAYFEALYAHFALPGVWELFPEVRAVLPALRARGFRLAVISNFDRRLHTILGHLGVAPDFEHVILSSEAGADKPDPRIFQIALETMGVAPAEALHAGDEPGKDGGAEAAGIRVFGVARPENSLEALLEWLSLD